MRHGKRAHPKETVPRCDDRTCVFTCKYQKRRSLWLFFSSKQLISVFEGLKLIFLCSRSLNVEIRNQKSLDFFLGFQLLLLLLFLLMHQLLLTYKCSSGNAKNIRGFLHYYGTFYCSPQKGNTKFKTSFLFKTSLCLTI